MSGLAPAPPIVEVDGVRRFDAPALQAQIDRIAASMPDGVPGFVANVGYDGGGVQAAAVLRIGASDWSVMGVLDKRFKGGWSGQASLRWAPTRD